MAMSPAEAPGEGVADDNRLDNAEDVMDRVIESAVVRSVFGHHEPSRREFMRTVGGGTMAAILASLFPMDAAKAAIKSMRPGAWPVRAAGG